MPKKLWINPSKWKLRKIISCSMCPMLAPLDTYSSYCKCLASSDRGRTMNKAIINKIDSNCPLEDWERRA